MCQTSVVLEKDNHQEKLMENVSMLKVTKEGISICALFEQPRVIRDVKLKQIDFTEGVVTLVPSLKKSAAG